MAVCHYVVADRHFIVYNLGDAVCERMCRRYGAFTVSTGGAIVGSVMFDLTIVPPFTPLESAREVMHFTHDGLDCFYEQQEAMVSISWRVPASGEILAQLHCDRNFRHAKAWLSGDDALQERCVDAFLMQLFALAALPTKVLLFHASTVAYGGKAYLFLGKSGTGKSTHSRLWLEHIAGTLLVNDDCPAVGIRDGAVLVYGTPWSGKTPCYKNVVFPVGAFVKLSQEEQNHIKREGMARALAILLSASSGVGREFGYERMRQDMVAAMLAAVPVYRLGCRPDVAAAELCYETLISQ